MSIFQTLSIMPGYSTSNQISDWYSCIKMAIVHSWKIVSYQQNKKWWLNIVYIKHRSYVRCAPVKHFQVAPILKWLHIRFNLFWRDSRVIWKYFEHTPGFNRSYFEMTPLILKWLHQLLSTAFKTIWCCVELLVQTIYIYQYYIYQATLRKVVILW